MKNKEIENYEDIPHECKNCGEKWTVRMLLVGVGSARSAITVPTYTGSDTYLCPKCKSENTIMFSGRKKVNQ